MKSGSFMRRVATTIGLVVIASSFATLLGPPAAGALERDGACRLPPNPARSYGPTNGPSVLYIGDSIANLEAPVYGYLGTLHNWHSGVLATGTATIDMHRCLNWLSWYFAHSVRPSATVIQLGTNDISGIDPVSIPDPNTRLLELARVFNEAQWAADYLTNNRCLIWIGGNEVFNTSAAGRPFTNTASVAAMDRYIKGLIPSHPNLHYGDYSSLIRGNATYKASLTTVPGHDGIHPHGDAGIRALGVWVTQQVDRYCL
jgi:lysophospholipase L1-like esterase